MPFSPSRRADFGPERPAPPPSPFDLTRSLPDEVGLAWPVDESLLPLRRPEAARYVPDPCGSAEARAAVARFLETLDAPCAADELVLASGTSDLIARLFEALTDPGDDILVPEPGYPLLDMILRTLGVVRTSFPLPLEDPRLDAADLRSRIGPRTKAIFLTSPHNPTGWRLGPDDVTTLAALGLPVISDEVFRGYDHLLGPSPSAVALRGAVPVAVLGGLSKAALLPGMKVAWAAISEPDGTRFRDTVALLCDTYLGVGSPALAALPRWLADAPRHRARVRERLAENLATLRDAVALCPALTAPTPAAGWYATLRLPAIRDDDAWTTAFAAVGVGVSPGWLFDFRGPPRVVVSLVTPPDIFAEGLRRLCGVVNDAARGL